MQATLQRCCAIGGNVQNVQQLRFMAALVTVSMMIRLDLGHRRQIPWQTCQPKHRQE